MFGFAARELVHTAIANPWFYVIVDYAKPYSPITSQPASLPACTFGACGAGEGVPPFNPHLNNGADVICPHTV